MVTRLPVKFGGYLCLHCCRFHHPETGREVCVHKSSLRLREAGAEQPRVQGSSWIRVFERVNLNLCFSPALHLCYSPGTARKKSNTNIAARCFYWALTVVATKRCYMVFATCVTLSFYYPSSNHLEIIVTEREVQYRPLIR